MALRNILFISVRGPSLYVRICIRHILTYKDGPALKVLKSYFLCTLTYPLRIEAALHTLSLWTVCDTVCLTTITTSNKYLFLMTSREARQWTAPDKLWICHLQVLGFLWQVIYRFKTSQHENILMSSTTQLDWLYQMIALTVLLWMDFTQLFLHEA